MPPHLTPACSGLATLAADAAVRPLRILPRTCGRATPRGLRHLKRTGGLARLSVRDKHEVRKEVHSYTAAANLGVILHTLLGVGAPRGLQSRLGEALAALFALLRLVLSRTVPDSTRRISDRAFPLASSWVMRIPVWPKFHVQERPSATGC